MVTDAVPRIEHMALKKWPGANLPLRLDLRLTCKTVQNFGLVTERSAMRKCYKYDNIYLLSITALDFSCWKLIQADVQFFLASAIKISVKSLLR